MFFPLLPVLLSPISIYEIPYNCHEADLVFGPGLPHKINNFDEAWNTPLICGVFHITGMAGAGSFSSATTKNETP